MSSVLRDSLPRFWVLSFLTVALFFPLRENTNGFSRHALLCAMSEDRAFFIDHYREHTVDWALGEDGHYYSNKAPGSAMVAFPVFWIVDKLTTLGAKSREARDERRMRMRFTQLRIAALTTQTIPFAILGGLLLSWLGTIGVSSAALSLCAAALFFGNTASLFMNTLFGHGLAAVCLLGMIVAFIHRRYAWLGRLFGFGLLCDYSFAVYLLPVAVTFGKEKSSRSVALFFLGGIVPAGLWIFYHVACFGGVFSLPNQFQNPEFVSTSHSVWGVLSFFPDVKILVQLLVGTSRGILWTQPWVLWTLSKSVRDPFVKREAAFIARLAIWGLFLLLWINGSFNGWHGGSTPGPRYLSSVFPAFALLLGLGFDRWRKGRGIFITSLVTISGCLAVVVYSAGFDAAPDVLVWGFYFKKIFQESTPTIWMRLAILSLLFVVICRRVTKKVS